MKQSDNPILSGVVLVIIGIVFLIAPLFTSVTMSVFVGAALLISGLSALFAWWNLRKSRPCGGVLAFAIIDLILAILCFTSPLVVYFTMETILSWCIIISGVVRIIGSVSSPFVSGKIMAFGIAAGVFNLIVGILALVTPGYMIYFLAVGLILTGITTIVMGVVAKKYEPIEVNPR